MAHQLLTPNNVCLQVIDVQEKLMAKIDQVERVTATVELMMRCAAILQLPVVANTQYIKGLGPYVGNLELLAASVPRFDKTDFNALANGETKRFFDTLAETVHTVAVVGVETHICVYQTAMALMASGKRVWIVSDAVSARRERDHLAGLKRLASAGAIIGPAEMLIYELLGKAGTPAFKQVLPLIVAHDNLCA
jgi:nicotinamidase-related amidase